MEKTGNNHPFLSDPRFAGLRPFARRLWLSSPTMHGEELRYIEEAIQANWVSTIGANIQEVERITAERIGRRCAVALSSGTAALHLAIKLCGERLYGQPRIGHGTLEGRKVFCSDMTFAASVNPVAQEGGEAVFIDAGWNRRLRHIPTRALSSRSICTERPRKWTKSGRSVTDITR